MVLQTLDSPVLQCLFLADKLTGLASNAKSTSFLIYAHPTIWTRSRQVLQCLDLWIQDGDEMHKFDKKWQVLYAWSLESPTAATKLCGGVQLGFTASRPRRNI